MNEPDLPNRPATSAHRFGVLAAALLLALSLIVGPGVGAADAAPPARPTIAGIAQPGMTLTAKVGTLAKKGDKVTYRWYRNGKRISDSAYKAKYYVPSYDDLGAKLALRVTVTSRATGRKTTYSSSTKTVRAPKRTLAACPTTSLASLAIGQDFAVALTRGGVVCTWGEGGLGQLGTGVAEYAGSPQRVALPQVTQIAAGDHHVLALTTTGKVYSWGYNDSGQLGIQDQKVVRKPERDTVRTPLVFVPREVAGLPKIAQVVSAGDTSLAITAAGATYAWGAASSSDGQSGAGSLGAQNAPHRLTGLPALRKVVTNGQQFLGLTTAGTVVQWGPWEVGLKPVMPGVESPEYTSYSPAKPGKPFASQVVSDIALNLSTAFAVKPDGTVYGWRYGGANGEMLPDTGASFAPRPITLPGLAGVTALYAGGNAVFATTRDGVTLTWGAVDAPDSGAPFPSWSGNPVGSGLIKAVTSPDISATTLAFAPGWAAALTRSGSFTLLVRDELNTYQGYPFRTPGHQPVTPRIRDIGIVDASRSGCQWTLEPSIDFGVAMVRTTTLRLGTSGLVNRKVDLDVPGWDAGTSSGGYSTTCTGTLSVSVKLQTTSVWTWRPDGKSWSKSATRRFS